MKVFGPSEFTDVVNACFNGDVEAPLGEAELDTEFTVLGYDSLTVYEIAMRIQDDYSVAVPDEELDRLTTPRAFIDYVSGRLPA